MYPFTDKNIAELAQSKSQLYRILVKSSASQNCVLLQLQNFKKKLIGTASLG